MENYYWDNTFLFSFAFYKCYLCEKEESGGGRVTLKCLEDGELMIEQLANFKCPSNMPRL